MDEKVKLTKSLIELDHAIAALVDKNIDLSEKNDDLSDFEGRKREYQKTNYYASLKRFELTLNALNIESIASNKKFLKEIKKAFPSRDLVDKKKIKQNIKDISHYVSKLQFPDPLFKVSLNVPDELKEEVLADVAELNKTFDSHCFRSSVILCGRLLETALHRKYFDATGLDILEKNPGIGLGKLIAKLTEKNVQFDPGLTQQIHLINQVRISSVHKKQQPFHPSEDQARAIILFTLDTLKKLF